MSTLMCYLQPFVNLGGSWKRGGAGPPPSRVVGTLHAMQLRALRRQLWFPWVISYFHRCVFADGPHPACLGRESLRYGKIMGHSREASILATAALHRVHVKILGTDTGSLGSIHATQLRALRR